MVGGLAQCRRLLRLALGIHRQSCRRRLHPANPAASRRLGVQRRRPRPKTRSNGRSSLHVSPFPLTLCSQFDSKHRLELQEYEPVQDDVVARLRWEMEQVATRERSP